MCNPFIRKTVMRTPLVLMVLLSLITPFSLAEDVGGENAGGEKVDGENEVLKAVYKMPVWMDQVQRMCPWKSSDGEGYVRVIRTEQAGRHQLYLQWIRKGIAGSPTQAVSTVQVEELAQDLAVKIQMPKPSLEPGFCKLTARAENIITERRYDMTLLLKGPGTYELNTTTLFSGTL
ncbi:hypothetical protein [Bacterioplanoides sp.]|uniref:hypothetical protein n=1 Tax=Bacterioplanoides sp. TaxID=2066072 RepID=UPI003AFFF82B